MTTRILATGLALFSMFFGAGNIIFPLLLGLQTGQDAPYAVLGILITAVAIPLTGVVGALLFRGDLKEFFSRMGKGPGYFLMWLILALLGPLGGLPRCIALSHATFSYVLPDIPLWVFSLFACAFVYLLSVKKGKITALLGFVLTPMLLVAVGSLIVLGLWHLPEMHSSGFQPKTSFLHGLKQGYQTLDLLAAFFFSTIVLEGHKRAKAKEGFSLKPLLISCGIAAFLLGLIYAGLTYVAASYLPGTEAAQDQIMAVLAFLVMGKWGGFFAIIAVILACLTTAISLAAIFSSYLSKEVLKEKLSYRTCLGLTLGLAFMVSLLKFTGIVKMIAPILEICYPALLLLTLLNIAYKMGGFKPVKAPVSLAFLYGLAMYAFQ